MDDNIQLRIFGENIRKQRLLKKMSQEELAFKAGLDRTYIGGIERGERNISFLNILKLAKALKIEIKALFEDIVLWQEN